MSCCGTKKKAHTKKIIENTILINRYMLRPDEIENFKQKFERMSTGSGFTKEDFKKNLSSVEAKALSPIADRIFTVMNKSKTGSVTLEEYLAYMDKMIYGTAEEKAIQSFSIIAGPESEGINYKEFKKWMISVSKMRNVITGEGFSMSDAEMSENFKEIDVKSDGIIDFEEYQAALSRNSEFLNLVNILKQDLTERLNVPIIEDAKEEDPNYMQNLMDLEDKISSLIIWTEEEYGRLGSVPASPTEIRLSIRNTDRRMTSARFIKGDFDEHRNSSKYNTVRFTNDNARKVNTRVEIVKEKLKKLLTKLRDLKKKGSIEDDDEEQDLRRTWTKSIPKAIVAKKNDVIYWGDEDWNLVLSMMIGIQMSVKATATRTDVLNQVTPDLFIEKVKHKLLRNNPKSKRTFKFRDYAPAIFERIRKLYGIKSSEYIFSLGMGKMMHALMANEFSSLTGQCTTGKSGSFFYYSDDGKYMLKTLSFEEYEFFRKFLPEYYFHLYKNPHTMITRFFGFHKIIVCNSRRKLYFVIMGNLFQSDYELDVKYDLKGSTLGRLTNESEDKSIARKDNNFIMENRKIHIGRRRKGYILEQMEKDVELMRRCNIIDYSLLLGIATGVHAVKRKQGFVVFSETDDGGMLSEDGRELYFMGIIDILTNYGTRKKLEHLFKTSIHKKAEVSCAPPDFYAQRFLEFMDRIME